MASEYSDTSQASFILVSRIPSAWGSEYLRKRKRWQGSVSSGKGFVGRHVVKGTWGGDRAREWCSLCNVRVRWYIVYERFVEILWYFKAKMAMLILLIIVVITVIVRGLSNKWGRMCYMRTCRYISSDVLCIIMIQIWADNGDCNTSSSERVSQKIVQDVLNKSWLIH